MTEHVALKDALTDRTVNVTIEADERGIKFGFSGYGDFGSADGFGQPVFIEFRKGQLIIHVWADIRKADPTHSISLECAHENLRLATRTKSRKSPRS